jgi:hypothetical protein
MSKQNFIINIPIEKYNHSALLLTGGLLCALGSKELSKLYDHFYIPIIAKSILPICFSYQLIRSIVDRVNFDDRCSKVSQFFIDDNNDIYEKVGQKSSYGINIETFVLTVGLVSSIISHTSFVHQDNKYLSPLKLFFGNIGLIILNKILSSNYGEIQIEYRLKDKKSIIDSHDYIQDCNKISDSIDLQSNSYYSDSQSTTCDSDESSFVEEFSLDSGDDLFPNIDLNLQST